MKTSIVSTSILLAFSLAGCAFDKRNTSHRTGKPSVLVAESKAPAPNSNAPFQLATLSESIGSVVETASFELESNSEPNPLFSNKASEYSLAEIEQLALANNPSLAALNSLSRKAIGLQQQVGIRPNPTLGYFGQQLADRGTDQQGFFVEQEFVRGNKLALNREVLGHTLEAQRWESSVQQFRILTDVRVLYFEASAAQQQLEAIRQFESVSKRGVEVALDRKKAEEGTLVEVLQSKTLQSEIALAAEQAEAAYRGAWRNLAAIAGLPETVPTRLSTDLPAPVMSPDWTSTYSQILSQSPERAVANALVCEKMSIWRRQQIQKTPNISTQLGTGYDNGTNSGMLNVQVGAPIPLYNKNAGNINAAYADYVRAVENVKRIDQSIQARLARAAQEYESALASVKKYEDEILPQVKQSLELSEQAYRAGELDFLQVLVVRRSYFESNIKFIQSKAKLAQANAMIDGLLLTGGLDAPQDYTNGDGVRGQSFGGQ